jgi:hypothetical protein
MSASIQASKISIKLNQIGDISFVEELDWSTAIESTPMTSCIAFTSARDAQRDKVYSLSAKEEDHHGIDRMPDTHIAV